MRVAQMVHPRQQRPAVGLAVRLHAADREAGELAPVVGALAADEARARTLAAQALPGERDLERGIDRLRAGVGEEHVAHAARRKRRYALREAERKRMADGERRRVVELGRL